MDTGPEPQLKKFITPFCSLRREMSANITGAWASFLRMYIETPAGTSPSQAAMVDSSSLSSAVARQAP